TRATAAQPQPTYHRNVLRRRDLVSASRARRARHTQVEAWRLAQRLAHIAQSGRRSSQRRWGISFLSPLTDDIQRLRAPLPVQHTREPLYDDVQEAAYEQPQEQGKPGKHGWRAESLEHRQVEQAD